MKRILVILILISPIYSMGQIYFYKTYSGSAFDEGQGVTQITDSSYAITGSSAAFSESSGQAYLMLVDSLGNQIWTNSYGGEGSDWGRRVFHKPGEGFVIAGYTNTTDDGSFNFYLVETDESGELISEKNFGTPNWDRLWDAVMLDDEGFLLVGETEGETSELKDMYIVRTNSQGDTLWTKTIATQYDDIAYAVEIIDDTTVVIGGDSWENEEPRGTIVNMHINGNINWQEYYGGVEETGIRDLEVYNNKIYAGGYIVKLGNDVTDFWILKTTLDGLQESDYSDPYSDDDCLSSINISDDDKMYLGMLSVSSNQNVFPGGTDVFILKFHTNLYYNGFSKSFSGVNPDVLHQMISTNDGGVAGIGTCGDDRVELSSGSDIMLVKIGPNDEAITTVDNNGDLVNISVQSKDQNLKVYPNPTAEKLFLPEKLKGASYSIYNSLGSKVQGGSIDTSIDVSNFRSGIYHIKVLHDNDYSTVRFIKK